MTHKKTAGWAWWLLPVVLAVPFLAALAAGMAFKGETIRELLNAAAKLVVIP